MSACKKHGEGPFHDCAYVDWRNSLIPLAEAVADAESGDEPVKPRDRAEWSKRWDALFHRAMRRFTSDPFSVAAAGAA